MTTQTTSKWIIRLEATNLGRTWNFHQDVPVTREEAQVVAALQVATFDRVNKFHNPQTRVVSIKAKK